MSETTHVVFRGRVIAADFVTWYNAEQRGDEAGGSDEVEHEHEYEYEYKYKHEVGVDARCTFRRSETRLFPGLTPFRHPSHDLTSARQAGGRSST